MSVTAFLITAISSSPPMTTGSDTISNPASVGCKLQLHDYIINGSIFIFTVYIGLGVCIILLVVIVPVTILLTGSCYYKKKSSRHTTDKGLNMTSNAAYSITSTSRTNIEVQMTTDANPAYGTTEPHPLCPYEEINIVY